MRYVPSEHIKKGMIIALPIMADNGSVLVNSGLPISDAVIRHVNTMGIQGVYIEEAGFEDIIVEDILPQRIKNAAYDALMQGDYDLCVSIAKEMVREIKSLRNKTINLIDLKSFKNYEYHHCVSVAMYAICLGYALKMTDEQVDNLAVAGILHDIGKFDVKKRVLNTKQIYNDKQMDEMMKHPMYSYEELKDYTSVSSVSRNAVLFHHENLDGSGYYKITADKLGIAPRILRIIDTYDALTATRRQRAAFSPAVSFKIIVKDAGKIYDKELVRTFIKTFPMYPIGYTVRLSHDVYAVVVSQTDDMERPIVRTFSGEEINLHKDTSYKGIKIEDKL